MLVFLSLSQPAERHGPFKYRVEQQRLDLDNNSPGSNTSKEQRQRKLADGAGDMGAKKSFIGFDMSAVQWQRGPITGAYVSEVPAGISNDCQGIPWRKCIVIGAPVHGRGFGGFHEMENSN